MSERWQIWKRKKGLPPGHPRIYVLVDRLGRPAPALASKPDIQCSTLDKIPFCMKPETLKNNYEPEGV